MMVLTRRKLLVMAMILVVFGPGAVIAYVLLNWALADMGYYVPSKDREE